MSRLTEENRVSAGSKTAKSAALVLWRTQHSFLSIEDLARTAGLHIELIKKLVEYGIIEPVQDIPLPLLFPASAVDRLLCLMRLRRDLGVNLAGAAVILEMREHLRSVRAELERIRRSPSE